MALGTKPKKHRIRFPSNPRVWKVPVNTSKDSAGGFSNEISVGDLIAVLPRIGGSGLTTENAGKAYPFTHFAYSDAASVADYFLGVAMNNSLHTQSKDILVAVDGVFEYPCTGGTHTVGQFVRAAVDGTDSVESASVDVNASTGNDLGRVSEANTGTTVTFQIKSKISGETG
jgi:hypothetical protein